MVTETRSAARTRATDALERAARAYGLRDDLAALKAAADWLDVALVMLAEAVEALLLDLPARPANVERRQVKGPLLILTSRPRQRTL